MKLSIKIFFGICIPSVLAVLIVSIILIDRTHQKNLEWETNRCVQEMKLIEMNLQNNLSNYNLSVKDLVELYSEYYAKDEINFICYNDGVQEYNSNSEVNLNNTKILDVSGDNFFTTIEKSGDNYYLFVSTQVQENQVIVYYRNIMSIYSIREELIQVCIITIFGLIYFISVIAYMIAKTLTQPLENMKKEIVKVSKGDYNIHLKEGKSEFGTLSKYFNQMSKELENRNNELMGLVNSKQTYIDDLSHEMNTPLTSILGYSELLEQMNCSEEQRIKYLNYIQEETKRIRDIYKKLLLLSYKKNSDLDMKSINVEKILKEIRNTLLFRLSENNIELIINNQLRNLEGDETLIIMCISNLISNAINVSKPNSKIILNAFETEEYKYVQVIDEGMGISKENIAKIIEPFYRVDKVRSRKNGGAGLGLSICKNIMEMHNGVLKITSELGKGSIFILEFKK